MAMWAASEALLVITTLPVVVNGVKAIVDNVKAKPSHYLVITGFNIPDMKVEKECTIWFGQSYWELDITPVNYTFEVEVRGPWKWFTSFNRFSPYTLPVSLTVGPRDEVDSLKRFAKRHMSAIHVATVIKATLEAETQLVAAGLSMEQVLTGAREFSKQLSAKMQQALYQYELHIYNLHLQLNDYITNETPSQIVMSI